MDTGQHLDPLGKHRQMGTLIRRLLDQQRLLEYPRSFCLLEEEDGKISKKIAAYHQFHGVRSVVEQVVVASKPGGDRKGGVVRHTQGTGKSIEMAWFGGQVLADPGLENPTPVMVTDRQALHGQLFGFLPGGGPVARGTTAGGVQGGPAGSARQPSQWRHHLHHDSEIRSPFR